MVHVPLTSVLTTVFALSRMVALSVDAQPVLRNASRSVYLQVVVIIEIIKESLFPVGRHIKYSMLSDDYQLADNVK